MWHDIPWPYILNVRWGAWAWAIDNAVMERITVSEISEPSYV